VRLLRSAAQVVADGAGAAEAVERGLQHPEHQGARRREIAEQLFYGAGGATARAVTCLYNLLSLAAPAQRAGQPAAYFWQSGSHGWAGVDLVARQPASITKEA
jgi:hypothetical protein